MITELKGCKVNIFCKENYLFSPRALVRRIPTRANSCPRIWIAGLNLGLCPANEGRRHKVTPSLIGWAQTWNQPWITTTIPFSQVWLKVKIDLITVQDLLIALHYRWFYLVWHNGELICGRWHLNWAISMGTERNLCCCTLVFRKNKIYICIFYHFSTLSPQR